MRLLSVFIIVLQTGAVSGQQSPFRREIVPLLETKCIRCHSGKSPKGDLDLSSEHGLRVGGVSGPVIDPSKVENSLLLQMVEQQKMPPKQKLTRDELAAMRKWVASGGGWDGGALRVQADQTQQRAGLDW